MITVGYDKFITKFPEFKDLTPDFVNDCYLQIGSLISPKEDCAVLSNSLREQGVFLATAVICKEYKNLSENNQQSGVISSASEGSDSVSFQAIPYKTMLEWDLTNANIQPYGKMLLRIIKLAQPKGFFNTRTDVSYYNMMRGK